MKTIHKYTTPTNLSSCEEYATIWIAEKDKGTQVWIQTSKDENKPHWVRAGDIIENYFIKGEFPPAWLSILGVYNDRL